MISSHHRKSRLRLRRSRPFACIVLYAVAFGLPLLWQYAGLVFIYPYWLAATAPDLSLTLPQLFSPAVAADASAQAYRAALALREQQWLLFAAASALAAWVLTLALQLLWRVTRRGDILPARATRRAVRAYRLNLLLCWALNGLMAAFVWKYGASAIIGFGLMDGLCYFGIYPLNVLAVMLTSRLAAPAAISGRGAFFKRL